MHLMFRFRLYSEKSEALVDIVIAALVAVFKTDIRCRPAISMRSMISMNSFHKSYQLFTFDVALGFIPLLPLVVSGSADPHKCTQILHIIITG